MGKMKKGLVFLPLWGRGRGREWRQSVDCKTLYGVRCVGGRAIPKAEQGKNFQAADLTVVFVTFYPIMSTTKSPQEGQKSYPNKSD